MFVTKNLYQNDDQWKDVPLGNAGDTTIGKWGCLLTSVTMMLNGIGYNETPVTVNDKMKKAGGFQGALFIPSVLPYVWPNCAYRDMQPCETTPAPIQQIDNAVAEGKPVILQVDWNKQQGIQTHFVLVKEKKGDDYVLYDPYKYGGDGPDKEVLLTTRYKYNGAKLATEISAVLWFNNYGINTPEPPQKTKLPL
ncbi:MAG TPA: C39 family peptidase, partial [Anaerolineales bacterium]|nr:C39 family peptidase [Anaerolineales bacterium]